MVVFGADKGKDEPGLEGFWSLVFKKCQLCLALDLSSALRARLLICQLVWSLLCSLNETYIDPFELLRVCFQCFLKVIR